MGAPDEAALGRASLSVPFRRVFGAGLSTLESRLVGWSKHFPLVVLMALYVVRFGTVTVDSLRVFQQDAYDLALYDQGIWLLSRFHAPFMTVMGTDLFAAHTAFIFLLLVPLYWVYPHTAALLVVQSMALALGAVPIYVLARRLLPGPPTASLGRDLRPANGATTSSFAVISRGLGGVGTRHDVAGAPALGTAGATVLATMLAAAYLLNPAVQQGNLEQFHVEAFEAPILGFAIYAAVVWRPRLLLVMVVLLLLCKQDDALYVVPLGLWVTFRRDHNLGLAITGGAVAVGLLENFVLIPALLNGIPISYAGWWPFGSAHNTLDVIIRKPGQFWNFATAEGRPWYLWQMVFSTGLLFLLTPGILAVALPELAADSLSSNPYLHQIIRHYSMPLAAVLLCATVCAIAKISSPSRRVFATAGVTLCALWAAVLWGDLPFSDNPITPPNPGTPAVASLARLVDEIPPNAVVSAAENFVPNLDHRTQIYMFPTPFSQSYYGNPRYDSEELPFASQVQYILVPACIACDDNLGESAQVIFDRVAHEFHEVGRASGNVLYERKA
jgi:uncharacterized membrane protein